MESVICTICLIISILIVVLFYNVKLVSVIIWITGIISTVGTLTMVLSALFLNIIEWWKDKYGKKK